MVFSVLNVVRKFKVQSLVFEQFESLETCEEYFFIESG